MLDGTTDTDGDVELRCDNLSGLADLEGVVCVASVDGGTRGTDGGVECVGEGLNVLLEVLCRLEGTATRDDPAGGCQVWPRRDVELLLDKGGGGWCKEGRWAKKGSAGTKRGWWMGGWRSILTFTGLLRELLHSCAATLLGSLVKGGATNSDDLDLVVALDSCNGVSGVDGPLEGVLCIYGDDVRDLGHVQEGCKAGEDVTAGGGVAGKDVAVAVLLDQGLEDRGEGLREQALVLWRRGVEDLGEAVAPAGIGRGKGSCVRDQGAQDRRGR